MQGKYHIGDGSVAALKLPLPNASAALMMAWMKHRACQPQATLEQRGDNGGRPIPGEAVSARIWLAPKAATGC